jgi:AmmeMemoRadiSam system protein A
MVPTALPESNQAADDADGDAPLPAEHRRHPLDIARGAIRHGLDNGCPPTLDLAAEPAALRVPRAAFVTLEIDAHLRGCIGHLQAVQPLVRDVADNAFAAAFRDPRFPPLRAAELAALAIKVSILTPATALDFADEADLIARLRPGVDGLILADGPHRGTFLPSVWEQLPQPRQFLRRLKEKAGLPADHWSDALEVFRYRTESFGD